MENQTISAMFDDYAKASSAVGRLEMAGVPSSDISLIGGDRTMRDRTMTDGSDADMSNAASGAETGASVGAALGGGAGLLAGLGMMAIPGVGPVVAVGWLASTLAGAVVGAATGAAAGGIIGSLTSAGIPEEHAHAYAEGIRRGATLVTAKVEPRLMDKARGILEAEGTVDMTERTSVWRQEGWTGRYEAATHTPSTGMDSTVAHVGDHRATTAGLSQGGSGNLGTSERMSERMPGPTTDSPYTPTSMQTPNDASIPVVEESLNVGKREVDAGQVRVQARMVEEPVSKSVDLRDEKVTIERRPVDRVLQPDEVVMPDRTIEAVESREIPMVSKEARVKEEIGLRKDVSNRNETVNDTVRHTEVKVDDQRPRTGQ